MEHKETQEARVDSWRYNDAVRALKRAQNPQRRRRRIDVDTVAHEIFIFDEWVQIGTSYSDALG